MIGYYHTKVFMENSDVNFPQAEIDRLLNFDWITDIE